MFRLSLLLGCLTVWMFGCDGRRGDVKVEKNIATVELLEIKDETVSEALELTGDVMPWEKLGLCFKVGGRVKKIYVDEGDKIRAGQLIAELDPTDYDLTRKLAQSQVDALKPHLERARKLRKADAVPESNLEELESRYQAASLQLSQAKNQLSYARLYAPMDGVVLQRMVAAGDMVGNSRPVIALVDLTRVKVILPLAQRHIGQVHEGELVTLTAPGLEGERQGKIHTIGLAADPKTRTIPVTVEIDNKDQKLRAGMLASVKLPVGSSQGRYVPFDVITRDLRGRPKVLTYLPEEQRLVSREVTVGSIKGDRIEMLSGLNAGDRILYRGIATPSDLIRVTAIHPSDDLKAELSVPESMKEVQSGKTEAGAEVER